RDIAVTAGVRGAGFRPPQSGWGSAGKPFASLGWSSLPHLWRLRAPTLVIAADRDPIIPVVNARILASLLPDARLRILQGGGHLFLITQADETADLVQEFLAGQARVRHSRLDGVIRSRSTGPACKPGHWWKKELRCA